LTDEDIADTRNVVEIHRTTRGAENYIVEDTAIILQSQDDPVKELIKMAKELMKQ